MKLVLLLTLIWHFMDVLHSRPQGLNPSFNPAVNPALTLRYDFDIKDDGGYYFNVATRDGTRHAVRGRLKFGELVVEGSYSYIGLDGVNYILDYAVDRNGFRSSKRPEVPRPPQPAPSITGLGGGSGLSIGGDLGGGVSGISSSCEATLSGCGIG